MATVLRVLWVLPATVAAFAAAAMLAEVRVLVHWQRAEAEVVRIHSFAGTGPFDRGQPQFAPVFRYVWTDGQPTEASVGMRHPDWNFAPGTRHEIRFHPGYKRDVALPGTHNLVLPGALAGLALVLALPLALIGRRRSRRRGMGENPPG